VNRVIIEWFIELSPYEWFVVDLIGLTFRS
jgi:hypothetical protein